MLLNIKFHADVGENFDNLVLKNHDFIVEDSTQSYDGVSVRSIFCQKTTELNEKEVEKACNMGINLESLGVDKIHYIDCKFKKESVSKAKHPLAISFYETLGIGLMTGLVIFGSSPTDWNGVYAGIGGSMIGYFVYEFITYLKKR